MEIINKTQLPIFDLHSDLLSYLSNDKNRTPYDLEVRCSIPQMQKGNVKVQTLAIFTETKPGSSLNGKAQLDLFKQLPNLYPSHFEFLKSFDLNHRPTNSIQIVAAIENASSICSEDEDLEEKLKHLNTFQKLSSKLFYISLTWNTENRFGGGALTKIGLKSDGKRLVDYLTEKKIALDLSHASDYLAYDLINYIDKQKLPTRMMASHSNMRKVSNFARNLPDDIALEIIKRKGVIGLNFIRYLLGKNSLDSIALHTEHLLNLNGGNSLCFGADFFYNGDVAEAHRKSNDDLFYPEFADSSSYPSVIDQLKKRLSLPNETLENICYKNPLNFIRPLA